MTVKTQPPPPGSPSSGDYFTPVPRKTKRDWQQRFAKLQDKTFTNSHTFLSKSYALMDEIISRQVAPKASCSSNCSNCCRVNVAMSPIEAIYIQEKTEHRIRPHEGDLPAARLPPTTSPHWCKFLSEPSARGKCTIYPYRPMACRAFLNFAPASVCEDPTDPHLLISLRAPGEGGVESLNLIAANVIRRSTASNPPKEHLNLLTYQLHDWFGRGIPLDPDTQILTLPSEESK